MKLDELKKMIAEEFESYMKEDEVDVSVGADDVDMDGEVDEPGEDIEETELEENSSTEASTQKTGHKPFGKSSAGANAGYGAVGGKGSTGYDAGSKALQERFQKLANIKNTLKG